MRMLKSGSPKSYSQPENQSGLQFAVHRTAIRPKTYTPITTTYKPIICSLFNQNMFVVEKRDALILGFRYWVVGFSPPDRMRNDCRIDLTRDDCRRVLPHFRSLFAASRMRASGLSAALRRCGSARAASPRSRRDCPSLRCASK